jgi:FkbM family methyltransferase
MSVLDPVRSVMRNAALVQERAAFAARAARRREEIARYHLTGGAVAFHLRHATPDVNTLEQVVGQGHYDLPAPVAAALDGLGRPPEIVDLGANIGLFGVVMLDRFPGSRVVAYEPDPANAAILRRSVQANGARHRWELREACAGVAEGSVRFQAGDFANSRIAESDGDGIEVPVLDAYADLERADFVKIDIEGAEWPLVADGRFAVLPATVVAFEYHPYGAPGDPEEAATAALQAAGFEVGEGHLDSLPGHGMVWGWKTAR